MMRQFGKILVVLVSVFLLSAFLRAQPDPTFGTNGRVFADLAQKDSPVKILQKPGGKILVLSDGETSQTITSFLSQYNSNGTPDSTFGNNGVLQIADAANPNRNFIVKDAVVQSDEKTIVAGQFFEPGNTHSFVVRLNPNGSVDTSFGNAGFQYPIMSPTFYDYIEFVTLLPDGRISAAGKGGANADSVFFLQYNSNGTLDTTFNGQGYVYSASPNVDKFFRQSSGKFLLSSQLACCSPPVLKRFNTDGSPDNSFSTINLPTSGYSRIFVAPDDKIYVLSSEINDYPNGGHLLTNRREDVAVYRYSANGAIDNTFGTGGKTKFGMAGYFNNKPFAMALRANGQIIVGAEATIQNSNRRNIFGRKFGVAKLESNGVVSGRFLMTDINSVETQAFQVSGKLTVLSNGKILSVFSNEVSSTSSNLVVSQLTEVQPIRYNVRISPFAAQRNIAYPSVFRPNPGAFYYFNGDSAIFGNSTDIPAASDYFDGLSSSAIFRPSNGTWYLCNTCGEFRWGANGDIPVYTGDYDGDSRADFTTFRPSNGVWSIHNSESATNTFLQWGINGDKPVAGDYDGDGRDDVAVFRPSNGVWYILNSSNNQLTAIAFGTNGDIPVQEDYDGDGRTDISVYRPSNGTWYRLNSSTNYGFFAFQWGIASDIPVPADYNGDGKIDLAVFRNGNWFIMTSDSYSFLSYNWGLPSDIPIPRRQ